MLVCSYRPLRFARGPVRYEIRALGCFRSVRGVSGVEARTGFSRLAIGTIGPKLSEADFENSVAERERRIIRS